LVVRERQQAQEENTMHSNYNTKSYRTFTDREEFRNWDLQQWVGLLEFETKDLSSNLWDYMQVLNTNITVVSCKEFSLGLNN